MIRRLLFLAFTASLSAAQVHAAEASLDPYFDAASGKLVIPQLNVNGKIYYATLTLVDGSTLTFSADFPSLTNMSPPELPSSVNADASDIVGTWTFPGMTVDQLRITFNANGTYEHFEADDDEECDIGTETGTYAWSTVTGTLVASVQSDGNGQCGLSHPRNRVPLRVFVDGNMMKIVEQGQTYGTEEFAMVRVSP